VAISGGNAGTLSILVRAVTTGFEQDLRSKVQAMDAIGEQLGQRINNGLNKGLNGSSDASFKTKVEDFVKSIDDIAPKAEKSRKAMMALMQTGFIVQGAIGAIAGSVVSLVAGLAAIVGSAGAAAASLVAVGGAMAGVGAGMKVAKLALGGVGAAASALNAPGAGAAQTRARQDAERSLAQTIQSNDESVAAAHKRLTEAQRSLTLAVKAGREQMIQLGFDAEQAALSEKSAGLSLEKARLALARTQDLPPNSLARREAELGYQEAELAFRRAKEQRVVTQTEQSRVAAAGIMGIESVRSATLSQQDAQISLTRTIRTSLQQQASAERSLALIRSGSTTAAYIAMAKLTKSQKEFAIYLSKLQPVTNQLKEAAASGFLPILRKGIDQLVRGPFFPVLKSAIHGIGVAMGDASLSFTGMFNTAQTQNRIKVFASTSATVIRAFGITIGNAFSGMLGILQAAAPLTKQFVGWLATISKSFSDWVTKGVNSGSLQAFFLRAGDLAKQFGAIASNVFGGLKALVDANVGPTSGGQLLINWLKDATAKFKAFSDVGRVTGNQVYFIQAAANTKAMLQTLGAILGTFKDLGNAPEIQTFWATLRGAVPAVKAILDQAIKTTPAFGRLLAAVVEFFAKLTDAGPAKVFFDSLASLVSIVNKVADVLKPLLAIFAPFLGVMLAVTLASKGLSFAYNYVLGTVRALASSYLKLFGETERVTKANSAAAKTTLALQKANIAVERSALAVAKAESALAAQRSRAAIAAANVTKAELAYSKAQSEAAIAETEALKISNMSTVSDDKKAAAAARAGAAVDKETQALLNLEVAQKKAAAAAQGVIVKEEALAVANSTATVATEKQTTATQLNETALKKANKAKNGFFANVGKGAGWSMAALILVDVITQIVDSFKQARLDAALSSEQIQNSLITAGNGFKTLKDTIAGVDLGQFFEDSRLLVHITWPWEGPPAPTPKLDAAKAGIQDLSQAFVDLNAYQGSGWWTQAADFLGNSKRVMEMDQMSGQMKKLGTQLSNLADSNLPAAQKAFYDMALGVGYNDQSMTAMINTMPDFKTKLTDIATQMGLAATDQNLLDVALNQGVYAQAAATQAARDLAGGIATAASKMINYDDAISKATRNGKVSLSKFLKEQQKQIQDAAAYQNNLLLLSAQGASEATLKGLEAMDPKVAAQLAQQMLDGGLKAIKASNATFGAAGASVAASIGTGLATQTTVVQDAFTKVGSAAASALAKGMTSGKLSVEQAQTKLTKWSAIYDEAFKEKGKAFADKLAAGLADGTMSINDAIKKLKVDPIKVDVKVDKTQVQKQINQASGNAWVDFWGAIGNGLSGNGFSVSKKKDGGLLQRFAGGSTGQIFGKGGPRDDLIPAMISSGEFVVNALSTKKYLPLLKAVNNGSASDAEVARLAGMGGAVAAGTSVYMTINPAAGMDERELASMVSRELALQMRKGANR